MKQQKILIVDDERNISALIAESLYMHGEYQVEKACDGKEGFEKYRTFMPDLVLMDIEMPVMDGYESSSRIKSYDPGARIVILTGHPDDHRARKTIEEGIALILLKKPIRLNALNRAIMENLPTLAS